MLRFVWCSVISIHYPLQLLGFVGLECVKLINVDLCNRSMDDLATGTHRGETVRYTNRKPLCEVSRLDIGSGARRGEEKALFRIADESKTHSSYNMLRSTWL